MRKYKAVKKVQLEILNHKRMFEEGEEVYENAFTKSYPTFFKKIGIETGYTTHLAKPLFIPDPIEEFVQKEKERAEKIEKLEKLEKLKEFEEFEEPPKPKKQKKPKITVKEEPMDINGEFDVKIETEE